MAKVQEKEKIRFLNINVFLLPSDYSFLYQISLEGWALVFICSPSYLFAIHSSFDKCPTPIWSLLHSYLWISKMRSKGSGFLCKKKMQFCCFTVRPKFLVISFWMISNIYRSGSWEFLGISGFSYVSLSTISNTNTSVNFKLSIFWGFVSFP